MTLFNVLSLIGGLSLFLFGMNLMGEALERRAGGSLKRILGKLTSGRIAGLLTGLAVTAVIQSSSATTVMVVGFVNSGLMDLTQAINVIMGANVGTTVTAWLLSLSGLESSNMFVRLLKPSSFTPVLALIGVIMYIAGKGKKKDTGTILLGFATLMFGMETMSRAVAGLKDVPEFANILLMFSHPILGVVAGALLTAIIQSSSASVGILQALASTGTVTIGTAIPIIMGQNIGTCITAILSSIGTNKNARRAALVHLCFNVIGTVVWLSLFCLADVMIGFHFTQQPANQLSIAVIHTAFNIACTLLILPFARWLENLACRIIRDSQKNETDAELDERLMSTPAVAIAQCRKYAMRMSDTAFSSLDTALTMMIDYSGELAEQVRREETECDHMEDVLGTYLVRLSTHPMNDEDSIESSRLLRVISDLERISDYAVALLTSSEELEEKQLVFSENAQAELFAIRDAVRDISSQTKEAFATGSTEAAACVEPLRHVIVQMKEQIRIRHVQRLQQGLCSIPAGFILTDILTDLERAAGHCSNIAGCVLEMGQASLDLHSYLSGVRKESPAYGVLLAEYEARYVLPSLPRKENNVHAAGSVIG